MLSLSPNLTKCCIAFCAIFLFSLSAFAGGDQWGPVDPAELAMKEPKIEKDADAEALYWEVSVANEDAGTEYQTVLQHYIRIKIFNDRGREQFSKVDIPFYKISRSSGFNIKIRDIAARTTKADGSSIELKPEDIFERDIVKGDGIKVKAKSFAVPGIEAGAIIEYRWKEIRNIISYHLPLDLSREIPVHLVKYYVKPIAVPGYNLIMHGQVFNGKNTPFTKEKNGFYSTTVSSIPAFKEEPRMPAENAVRPWMLLYYTDGDGEADPKKFWKEHGKTVYEANKQGVKVSDEVRAAAQEAVGDATAPEQKVERIFNYIRAKIKNVHDDTSNFTDKEKKKVQDNKTPSGTLKLGFGDSTDINRLFVAMVTAAGLEARITSLPRRSDANFNINFTDNYFMRTSNVAVKVGDTWKFYDPAVRYLPFGMLWWDEEAQPVLVSDPKEPIWTETKVSPPEKSMEKRIGRFHLLEDGTLEGIVKMEFTGHLAAYHKEYNDEETQQAREDILKNLVRTKVLGSAEVTNIRIENVTDPDKPFVYSFNVKVPGYATRTGKRIFIQPNFFERSAEPVFKTSTRRYDIYFNYPYSEQDDILIELPSGYSLESPDVPAPINDAQKISSDEVKMGISNDGKWLTYKRNFYFGNDGMLNFPAKSYTALKALFDAFHKVNTHSLTLKQGAATAAATAPPKGN